MISRLATLKAAALVGVIMLFSIVTLIFADLRQHTENKAHIAKVEVKATQAQILALRDHALIYAVCREINRRDRVLAYYDTAITHVARQYGSRHNAYAKHVRPLFEARAAAMMHMATSDDCETLMQAAMNRANRMPAPTGIPIPVGTAF